MSLKDDRLFELEDENDALRAKIKVLRANLRKEKRWSKALLYAMHGDPLPTNLEKEFGEILDKL